MMLFSIVAVLLGREGRVSHGLEQRTKICSREIDAEI